MGVCQAHEKYQTVVRVQTLRHFCMMTIHETEIGKLKPGLDVVVESINGAIILRVFHMDLYVLISDRGFEVT